MLRNTLIYDMYSYSCNIFLVYHDCMAIYNSYHYNAHVTQVTKIQNLSVCETWLF